ncbi:hypothetical protein [Oceanibacterium hippocampi]|nr:hypothetical protein [Oceanibacterium hippocampi]
MTFWTLSLRLLASLLVVPLFVLAGAFAFSAVPNVELAPGLTAVHVLWLSALPVLVTGVALFALARGVEAMVRIERIARRFEAGGLALPATAPRAPAPAEPAVARKPVTADNDAEPGRAGPTLRPARLQRDAPDDRDARDLSDDRDDRDDRVGRPLRTERPERSARVERAEPRLIIGRDGG